MKKRIYNVFAFKSSMVGIIILSLTVIFLIFVSLIFFREHTQTKILDMHNKVNLIGEHYAIGYMFINSSYDELDNFFITRNKVDFDTAQSLLSDAAEELDELILLTEGEMKRQFVDLKMMVHTCKLANEKAYLSTLSVSHYNDIYNATRQYSLLRMMYSEGWDSQQEHISIIREEISTTKLQYDLLFVIVIVPSFFCVGLIAIYLIRRVRHIIKTVNIYAEQFENSEFEENETIILPEKEFEPLVKSLNRLVENVQLYLHEKQARKDIELKLAQERLQKTEISEKLRLSQIKELQATLNPHFLFNTLNLMACTAYIENANETQQLMQAVSTILRYHLDQRDIMVEVAQEVAAAKQYMVIENKRFDGKIDFKINVEKECLNYLMPAITLQPILENCIIHGLNTVKHKGIVCVTIKMVDDYVLIEVKDNGIGFDEDVIKKILSGEAHKDSHLGLHTVFERFWLIYGRKGSEIKIASKKGRGSTVSIKFAKQPKNIEMVGCE